MLKLKRTAEALASYEQALARDPQAVVALFNRGNALFELERLEESLDSYARALRIRPDFAEALQEQGKVLQRLGRIQQAQASFDAAFRLKPDLAMVTESRSGHTGGLSAAQLCQRGNAMLGMRRLDAALACYDKALELQPDSLAALNNRGNVLLELQRPAEALQAYERAAQVDPRSVETLTNQGNAQLALKRPREALVSYDRALAVRQDFAAAWNNRGNALLRIEDLYHEDRASEALECYERAIRLNPDFADAVNNRGSVLQRLDRREEALGCYERAIQLNPASAEAFCNRGGVLLDLARIEEALASLDHALRLRPDYPDALNKRGRVLMGLNRFDAALTTYDRALEVQPDSALALNGRASALLSLKRYGEAIEDFASLVEREPDHDYARGNLMFARLAICDWTDHEKLATDIVTAVNAGRRSALPFSFLPVTDSAGAQLASARTVVQDGYPPAPTPLWAGEIYKHDRIRVAYISPDYREHPVSYLMVGLFEKHDRQRFETIGVSLRADDGSATSKRIKAACDRFIDAKDMPDAQLAAHLRELKVDIAVDLAGFTEGLRTGVFAERPAPIQVNYLGYPGTMGAPYLDYILADDFVIPEHSHIHYAERIVSLPDCFQVNDADRTTGILKPGRTDAGLPATGLVLCSFNNSHKLNPQSFDIWMRILRAVPGSVLWLVQGTPTIGENLRREAARRGVEAERLIFAPKLPYPLHLSRLRLADLFLDSLPFNAGATASDALWSEVPVVTCAGEAFASRMAGSLLRAVGLPELITHNVADYEALAMRLATNPAALADVRARLASNRTTCALFDTDRFRRHIEAAYVTMWDRYQRGESPQSFSVPRQ